MNNIVKKVMVYPFYDEFIPVVKFLNKMNSELKVCSLVSPKGFGLEGKDSGEAYGKNKIGLKVTNDFDKAITDNDVLFVTNGHRCNLIYEDILNKMKKAIGMRKEVICTLDLCQEQINKLTDLADSQKIKFTYYNTDEKCTEKKLLNIEKFEMKNISTPVIYIGEILDGFQGFEILLRASIYLKEQGYRVLSIGKPKYSSIFNIKSMPSFLYGTDLTEEDKIFYFNNYIYELESETTPDVIIIQLPDNLLKYNESITNQFGIYSYIVSQAIRGDYFIYCYQYDNSGPQMLKMLNDTFKYRFGLEINAVNMANKYLDTSEDIVTDDISPLWFEQSVVNESIKKNYSDTPIPVYNCEDNQQSIQLFENMIHTLAAYGDVSII